MGLARSGRPNDKLRQEPGMMRNYTNRICSTAVPMNEENGGCGANGRDFSSDVCS